MNECTCFVVRVRGHCAVHGPSVVRWFDECRNCGKTSVVHRTDGCGTYEPYGENVLADGTRHTVDTSHLVLR